MHIRARANQRDLANLEKLPRKQQEGLFRGMKKAMKLVEKAAIANASGGVLQRRTGKLASSIGTDVKRQGTSVLGVVGTLKGNVDYAATWEFGGKYPQTVVETVKAKALRFLTRSGTEVFAKRVTVRPHVLKKKPFLKPAITDNMATIISYLEIDTAKEMNK